MATATTTDLAALFAEADTAGHEAAAKLAAYEQPLDCGYAWVTIKPANSPFARAAQAQGRGHRGYRGGWEIMAPTSAMGEYGQSCTMAQAWAAAFATRLADAGIRCETGSRLD